MFLAASGTASRSSSHVAASPIARSASSSANHASAKATGSAALVAGNLAKNVFAAHDTARCAVRSDAMRSGDLAGMDPNRAHISRSIPVRTPSGAKHRAQYSGGAPSASPPASARCSVSAASSRTEARASTVATLRRYATISEKGPLSISRRRSSNASSSFGID